MDPYVAIQLIGPTLHYGAPGKKKSWTLEIGDQKEDKVGMAHASEFYLQW